MKLLSQIIAICLISLIAFTQCKKATAGPKGDTGSSGSAGTNGTNGVANIQVFTFTTTSSSWTTFNWPYNYLEATLTVPAITSTVTNGGDVRVYLADGTGTSWIALPYPYFSTQYTYQYKTGQILIDLALANNAVPSNPGTQQYKVVILPPAMIKNNPNANWNDFNEVEKRISLQN